MTTLYYTTVILLVSLLAGCAQTQQNLYSSRTIGADDVGETEQSSEQSGFAQKSTEELVSSGFSYVMANNLPLAKLHFATVLKREPDNLWAHLGMGEISYLSANYPEALASYQRANAIDPKNLTAVLGQVKTMRRQGNLDGAVEQLSRAREFAPDDTRLLTELAITYDLQGQTPLAGELFREVSQKAPNQVSALNNLGLDQVFNKQYREAVTTLRQAMQLQPDDVQISNNLAMALALAGEEESALALFKKTVGEAAAWNNLGYLYMTQGRYDDSERALMKAQELNPKYYQKSQENLEKLKNLRSRSYRE